MNIYYVYAYLRKDGTPYYIGKGCGDRAYKKHKNVITPKNKNNIVLLEKNLTEVGSLALERRYIRWYGKKIDNTGILRNILDGGDGVYDSEMASLHMKKQWNDPNSVYNSTSYKKKKSEESLKKWGDPNFICNTYEWKEKHLIGVNNPFYGKQFLEHITPEKEKERRKKISKFQKNKTLTSEHKEKLRKPKQKLTCPFCHKIGGSSQMKRYHFDNCKFSSTP